MEKWLSVYTDRFEEYAARMIFATRREKSPLFLKLDHTRQVFAMTREISADIPPDLHRPAFLAALYHDVGRFEQYERYGTFKDAISCNHALLGIKIIKSEGFFDEGPSREKKLALTAIALHNRFCLPPKLEADACLVSKVVRDADKLDILRVMHEHLNAPGPYNPTVVLNLPDNPELYSEEVMAAAMSSSLASYADLKSVNDFRVLLGTWLYEMSFPQSRRLYVSQGYAKSLIAALPKNGPYAQAREKLLADIAERENGI